MLYLSKVTNAIREAGSFLLPHTSLEADVNLDANRLSPEPAIPLPPALSLT